MFSLNGKCVVVTGGGRGIGKGIARAMAAAGANVVITGRSAEPLRETAQELEAAGTSVLVVAGDLTSMAHVSEVVALAQQRFGYIDCWVNNAGSATSEDVGPLISLSEEQYDRVVGINMRAAFFCAQAAARAMTRGGSIINISSRSGSQPCPNTGQYGAAKAALESFTATMAVEWGHMNIRVNAVAPGVVLTEKHEQGVGSMTSDSRRRRQIETVPLRRLGRVDDVAYLCVYFASDEAEWVTGQVVQVNGGSRVPVGLLSYLHHVNRKMEEQEGGASS
jgi:NAD(P)-dependent dehydrogenase (short-subunit alcohol dehydrogenase family)